MVSTTSLLFAIVFQFVINLFCTPVLARRYPCDNLLARKEWRNMDTFEKSDYIKAIRCLQSQPSVDPPYPEAVSRFDEFQAHYIRQADNVHYLGQFLPWHRQYLNTFEKALRNECGYKGATPYWDWSQDADSNFSISAAPIFDPVTGFGGDGVLGTYALPANSLTLGNKVVPSAFRGCVRTGPFVNYTLNVGPGKLATRHCLTRGITDSAKKYLNSSSVASLSKSLGFETFRVQIQSQFDGGHAAVGGEMSNIYSSPGDPLFYLHIANIDRIWWNWQQLAPATRFFSVSGPASKIPPIYQVGVDYVLYMGSLGLSVPIRDVLDLWSKPNCYTYL